MRVRGKIVTELTVGDLDALIAAQPESRVLEYKADLPGGRDEDKREFLADVTALANTAGGAIIYGVETTRDGA
jgi:predicted HTH transcriptional regulator